MVMSAATLATELKNLTLFDTESAAAAALAGVFATYSKHALAGAAGTVLAPGLSACPAAMEAALSGMSALGQGASKIQAGIIAYWGAITPVTAWVTCTGVTPPPGLSGLATALSSVFASNISGAVTKDQAYDAIAGAIHTINASGGIAVFPVPPGGIGPQPIT